LDQTNLEISLFHIFQSGAETIMSLKVLGGLAMSWMAVVLFF